MASQTETIPINVQADRSFFGHPRGLATLFAMEMWERFSYYGMRAIFILFMTASIAKGGLGFGVSKAGAVYGLYTAMAYLMCLAGGWIADLFIGQRRAVLYGGVLIAAGEFCLFAPGDTLFYPGLVLLMTGTGFLKGNASTIVGQLYARDDPRRDSGFSIFYMGINVGALISPLICGAIGEWIGWRYGFAAAGVGMLAGVVQYVLTQRHLGDAGLHPGSSGDPAEDRKQRITALRAMGIALALIVLVFVLAAAGVVDLTPDLISDGLGWALIGVSGLVFAWLIFFGNWSAEERKRSAAILVLFIASAVFWAAYEQAGSSLTLFAEHSTNRHIFGFEFPASWYQFVQPFFVIALAPVFGWLWLALRNQEPSSPAKFTWGLVLGGLAFIVMIPAASIATGGGIAGPMWLVVCYLLQTLGELCLSPVGLSAMSKLAPARAAGFMMGIWFLSISIGNWMAGKAASLYSSFSLPTLFGAVAAFSLVAAAVLAILIKPTVRLMGGVK